MKTLYTLLIMLITFTGFSQTFEEVQYDGFIDRITTYEDGSHSHLLRSTESVPTELTNYFAQPCNATVCLEIRLGACPGDVNSEGVPYEFTEFYNYYINGNTILGEYENLIIRHCELDIRNGSIAVNGVNIEVQQDCDTPPDEVSQIIFTGNAPGQFYDTTELMNATLSIQEVTKIIRSKQLPENMEFALYDVIGRELLKGNTSNYTYNQITSSFKTGVYLFEFYTESVDVTVKDVFN